MTSEIEGMLPREQPEWMREALRRREADAVRLRAMEEDRAEALEREAERHETDDPRD